MTRAETILRWSVVATLLSGSAAALLGVLSDPLSRAEHIEIPSDELLAYNLTPPGSAVIALLPKAGELSLSSWCVVGSALPDQRFVYGITLDWLGSQGSSLGRSELSFESRVSGDAEARDASAWAARLAYSSERVTDSRTLRILIPELAGERPKTVRLSARAGAFAQVLVRTTFPEARAAIEVAAVERSLTRAERDELDRDRTSLPFDELSPAFRATALSHWQRRLDAVGVADRDYRVTRLLIGHGRAPAGLDLAQRTPQLVRESRALAFNVFGVVSVQLAAPAGAALRWSDGPGRTPELIIMGHEERQDLLVGHPGLASTLVLRSAEPNDVPVHATIRREDAAAVIGTASVASGDRLELEPSWLRSTYYRLDPEQPLPLDVAPGQTTLGLTVRGLAEHARGSLVAQVGEQATHALIDLPPSEFERWEDGSSASEARDLYLRLPDGVTRVEVRGDAALAVVPFTYDPIITEDRLTFAYQRPLAPGSDWRFADCDLRHRVSTRSSQHDRLVAEGHTLQLHAQARVVDPPPLPPDPGVALAPRGEGVRRHLVLPLARTPGQPPREAVWVTLDRARRVQIASAGARTGQATLRYRLAPEHLGQTLTLSVDGSAALSEPTVTTSAELELELAPGEHLLALDGLAAGDAALLEVAAAPEEPVLRQRLVHRLDPAQSLEFQMEKSTPQARLIVFAYAERHGEVALSYAIGAKTSQHFATSHSPLAGRLQGPGARLPEAWFWESTEPAELCEHRDGISLGADLLAGAVSVSLKNETSRRLWVATVFVARAPGEPDGMEQPWALEDR